jgi:hypothetical protein
LEANKQERTEKVYVFGPAQYDTDSGPTFIVMEITLPAIVPLIISGQLRGLTTGKKVGTTFSDIRIVDTPKDPVAESLIYL